MDPKARQRLLSLQYLLPRNDRSLSRLLLHYGDVGALWDSDWSRWPRLGLATASAGALGQLQRQAHAPACEDVVSGWLGQLDRVDAAVIPITADHYPPLLRTLADPPAVLFVRGRAAVLQQATLAVVGSRRASAQGMRIAERFGAEAASAGLVICSGLALGIDGAALRGCLESGAAGVAVMATGIEQVYPRRHRAIAEAMLPAGCLVTELPPGTPPLRHQFPRRNRIISGLALGVLVVEASLPSGSLITAGAAADQGRDVFAVPWSPEHAGGAGCLQLIRDGATLVASTQDILEELGWLPVAGAGRAPTGSPAAGAPVAGIPAAGAPVAGTPTAGRADKAQDTLLALLGAEPVSVDELALRSGWPVPRILAVLSSLELSGSVVSGQAGYSLG